MLRKHSFWNSHQTSHRKNHKKKSRRTKRISPFRSMMLGIEWLEDRVVLSANPVLGAFGNQTINEGSGISVTGNFTDLVEGGPPSIGLNPTDYTAKATANGAFSPLTAVTIDTDTLQITGGFDTPGTEGVLVNVGTHQVAVFPFTDFDLASTVTINTQGTRPLALLSLSNLDVGGIIDVSARIGSDTSNNNEQVAGPGGGNGGLGSNGGPASRANGGAAAGATAQVAQWNYTQAAGGTGGGFGGRGGAGERTSGFFADTDAAGQPYGNLMLAIQGGGGGSTAAGLNIGNVTVAGGGGGGGGIELGAVGTITITGQVLADGGDGHTIALPTSSVEGGGGGGAGGGILVHANSVSHSGTLSAKGGKGGDGAREAGGGGGGLILVVHSSAGTFNNTGIMNAAGGLPGGADGLVVQAPNASGVSTTPQVVPLAPAPIIETYDYVIDWDGVTMNSGPASATPAGGVGSTRTGSFTSPIHTYTDNAAYTVSVTVNDNNGGSDTKTFMVTIVNVAPTAVLASDGPVDEGESATVSFSGQFDPSGIDNSNGFHYAYDFNNDGTWEVGDGSYGGSGLADSVAVPANFFADGSGSRTVKGRIIDKDGGFTDYTTAITINNVAPVLTIGGPAFANEGDLYTLNLSSLDPGTDTITSWTINWGDGTQVVPGNPLSVTHTYFDDDVNYIISATATDEDGIHAAGNTVEVDVLNVGSTLAISGAASISEGSVYTLNLTDSDPGNDTITQWEINWGDSTQVAIGNPLSVTHTYADGDVDYVISATATDEDGTFAAGNTVAVDVLNVAPTLAISGAASVNAGSIYTLTLSSNDPGADTISGWLINWGDGSQPVIGNPSSVSHTYATAGPYNISATATDEDGTFSSNTLSVTVNAVGGPAQGTTLVGSVLHVVGTTASSNTATITLSNGNISVNGSFNGSNPVTFPVSAVTQIVVQMSGSTDILITASSINVPMIIDAGGGNDLITTGSGNDVIRGGAGVDIIYGGDGNDVLLGGTGGDDLFGGNGNDVLIGGDGTDMLFGGSGRDLLIGSQDEDLLNSGNDDDILIGGYTSYDEYDATGKAAIDAVMAIWTSAASFTSRVNSLTGSGGLLQANAKVFDDNNVDMIVGGSGRDLVFGDNSPIGDGVSDLLSLNALQDTLIQLT